QFLATALQSSLDGRCGPAEPMRCLFLRQSLQITQHQRRAKLLRQRRQLRVEDRSQFAPAEIVARRRDRRRGSRLGFLDLPASLAGARSKSDMISDALQPAAQSLVPADGAGFLSKDEKRRLKRILGVITLAQYRLAHRKHHRAMTLYQVSKR